MFGWSSAVRPAGVRELPFELIATCPNCEEFAFHKGPGTSSEAFARPPDEAGRHRATW